MDGEGQREKREQTVLVLMIGTRNISSSSEVAIDESDKSVMFVEIFTKLSIYKFYYPSFQLRK